MYIIDFGRAVFFPKGMTERNFYTSVLQSKDVFRTSHSFIIRNWCLTEPMFTWRKLCTSR